MVGSLKRILVALRNEHRVIMEALDQAIEAIESPERARRIDDINRLTASQPTARPTAKPIAQSALNSQPILTPSNSENVSPGQWTLLVNKVQSAVGSDNSDSVLDGYISVQLFIDNRSFP